MLRNYWRFGSSIFFVDSFFKCNSALELADIGLENSTSLCSGLELQINPKRRGDQTSSILGTAQACKFGGPRHKNSDIIMCPAQSGEDSVPPFPGLIFKCNSAPRTQTLLHIGLYNSKSPCSDF